MALGLVVVLAVAGLLITTTRGRRLVFESVLPTVRRAWNDLTVLARDPTKLTLLFGGSLVAKLATIVAFVLCARAFEVDESFARLRFST